MKLPRHEEPSTTRDDAAAFGTLVHHWKETGETNPGWADPRHTVCLNKKLDQSGVRREDYWSGNGEHEPTFAINLETAELVLYEAGKFPATDADQWKKGFPFNDYVTGSIDWLERGSTPWVDDLKTGRWPVDVKKSKQLLSYLLVPWIEMGMPLVNWEGVVTITQWPRYPLAGQPKRSRPRRVKGFEMAEHLEDLRYAVSNTDEVNPTGEHCRFCPCAKECDGYSLMAAEHLWR